MPGLPVCEEDQLVAAEETGTGAGGHVQQSHPRESKVPPQPAGRRRKRAHAVMAAAVHYVFYYNVGGNRAAVAEGQVPSTRYLVPSFELNARPPSGPKPSFFAFFRAAEAARFHSGVGEGGRARCYFVLTAGRGAREMVRD